MRRTVQILMLAALILAGSGCDAMKALGRVQYFSVGRDGIQLSLYPRASNGNDEAGFGLDWLGDIAGFLSAVVLF